MEINNENNLGITIFNIIKELDQTIINALREKGKTEDEIVSFFESNEYQETYIEAVCPMLISSFSESLKKYILEDDEAERREQDLFLEHLHSIWGIGIAWMKQYRRKCFDICEGWGWYINQSHIVSDRCNVFNALQAIHGKALLVYAEIICLLENGFPDGAYAHYRTLYEIWAVAEFLYEDLDDVSVAYIKSMDDKSDSETGHYKWARTSKRFAEKDKDITIFNIVTEAHKTFANGFKEKISNTHLKKIYTFPNKIIHPSAEGVFRRTSRSTENGITTGAADNGLATPAINSSMTMYNITRLFLGMIPNPASAIGIHILSDIIGKRIIPFFEEAESAEI
ncbi:MAG: DUF5677 domain-containing protein [Oscillospiraceae bacterium]|nr:DUF5677 domain-containing protein [Oscillospiraceae bacterium]